MKVAFTGHRPKSLPWGYDETRESCLKFKEKLKTVLIGAVEYGVDTFFSGMAEGFDMIATEIVIELKKIYSHIKIIAVVPCLNQEIRWSENQQNRYHQILQNCDEKIVLSQIYTSTCMNERNKFMVDRADILISCFNGKPSGTGNTIHMAKEKGLKVRNINPENFR